MRSNHIAKLDDIVKCRTNMSELNMKAISHRERERERQMSIWDQVSSNKDVIPARYTTTPQASTSSLPKNRSPLEKYCTLSFCTSFRAPKQEVLPIHFVIQQNMCIAYKISVDWTPAFASLKEVAGFCWRMLVSVVYLKPRGEMNSKTS